MSNWELEWAEENFADAMKDLCEAIHDTFGEYGEDVELEVLRRCMAKCEKAAMRDLFGSRHFTDADADDNLSNICLRLILGKNKKE